MKKKLVMIMVAIFMCQSLVSADDLISIDFPNSAFNTMLGVEKGQCGDNLEWSMAVTAQRELHITGTGDMYNYDEITAPWSEEVSKVYLNEGITYIGNYAFYNLANITEIDIPDTVTEIGYDAFKNCAALVSVDIPDNITIIGSSAFEGCSNLCYITLPSNIKNIYHFTFAMCKNLEEIEIYDGVKEIGQGAFTNCLSLATIHIPDSVEKIGNRTFYGCNSLKTVYYSGSKAQWENILIASGNSALDNAEIVYLTEDEIVNNEICYLCENKITSGSLYYDEDGNVICRSCNDELQQEQEYEKIICSYCEKEITNNDTFYDNDNNLICQSCYNELQAVKEGTEKTLCVYCEEEIIGEKYYDENKNIICQLCYEELSSEEIFEIECPYCGETFEDSEDIYDSEGMAVCPYCNEYLDDTEEVDEQSEITFATSDWALEEVNEAYQNNLIPNEMLENALYKTISREEFAAVAVKLYENIIGELPVVNIDDTPFTDCNYASEYNDYIAIAYELGITNGTTSTTFSPYENITREQLATMLSRVALPPDNRNVSIFADDSEISDYAKDAVYLMAMHEIIKGVGGNCFAPQDTATKEQAILIALRIFNNYYEW